MPLSVHLIINDSIKVSITESRSTDPTLQACRVVEIDVTNLEEVLRNAKDLSAT